MATTATRVWTDVDFDRSGKQAGWLYQPHSVTRSGYGHVATPIAVIKNGKGPTALFMAGNHGDEYEGQVALTRLIRRLRPAEVRGRIIVVPAANLPAAMAGVRTSPLDEGNLNRAFPGDPDGTSTFAIALYFDSVLFPMADVLVDVHSGGTSMDYLPFASICVSTDAEHDRKTRELLVAFDAPISILWDSVDSRMAEIAAARHGVLAMSGEFGGGGAVAAAGVAIVERGLANVLEFMGITRAPRGPRARGNSRLMEIPGFDHYVFASDAGLFEPLTELGQEVRAGQPCGRIHFVDDPLRRPVVEHYRTAGLVVCKRHPGRVQRGDCVAHLARDAAG